MRPATPLRIAAAFAVGLLGAALTAIACLMFAQPIAAALQSGRWEWGAAAPFSVWMFTACLLATIPGGLGGAWLVLRFDRPRARRYLVAMVGGLGGWLSAFFLTALLVFGLMALLTAIATGEFDAPSMRGVAGDAALFASLTGSVGGFGGGYWLALRRGTKAMYWLVGGGALVIAAIAAMTLR